ncbi:MAG TPA: TIGR02996 domain-containing protein [Kofleriaceae bacterium]|nr:TIGR02996 domain-containing protein [Kofleriaceae bacterium]
MRGALELLLAAWRDVPDAELATAIDVVGLHAARGTRVRGEWLTAAKRHDPVELHHLIATLNEIDLHDIYGEIPRIEALAGWGDPRADMAIATQVQQFSGVQAQVKRALAALRQVTDPRVLDRLPDIEEHFQYGTGERTAMASCAKHLRATLAPATLPADDVAHVRAILERLPVADDRSGEAELLAAVYESPDDDAPRAVYADWLLERGEPRGELIALQLKRERSREDDRRIHELESAHLATWLGPLATVPGIELRRGFIGAVTGMAADWLENLRSRELPDDPQWATLEECVMFPPPRAFTVLRRLGPALTDEILRLPELPANNRIEEIIWSVRDGDPIAKGIAAYRKAKLPALRALRLEARYADGAMFAAGPWRPAELGWIFERRRLDELTLGGALEELADYVRAVEPTTVQRFGLGDRQRSRVVMSRDSDGQLSSVEIFDAKIDDRMIAAIERCPHLTQIICYRSRPITELRKRLRPRDVDVQSAKR